MSSQQALLIKAKFAPFTLESIPIPKPGPGEVLVEVKAVALNPVDWKVQKYGVFLETYPASVGTDIAGDVVELGEGVTTFAKGDRVFFQGVFKKDYTGYQQYTKADANTIAKIPSKFSYDEVSTISVTLTAAYVGFYNTSPYGLGYEAPLSPSSRGKHAGTPFLILGGSSSVGQFAIQLAAASGFSPIITTSSLKHTEFLKSIGATHVIDRNLPLEAFRAEVQKVTQKPIPAAFDAISLADTQKAAIDILAPGGKLVIVLAEAVEPTEGKKIIRVVGSKVLQEHAKLIQELYVKLSELVEEGIIKPNRVEVLPGGLDGIVGGLKRLENGQVSGIKLAVRPHET